MKSKLKLGAAIVALTALAPVVQASTSSVTLYGILSPGVGWQALKGTNAAGQKVNNKTVGLVDQGMAGNRFGFKGKEDLGNGLSAVFMLESGFSMNTGNHYQADRLFGRQATLGLSSESFGLLELGRQTNITSKYISGMASPFGGNGWQVGIGATMPASNTVRYDNLVMYQSPVFSGFQFGAGYSFNTNGTQLNKSSNAAVDPDKANVKAISAGLQYNNGPLGVALAYEGNKYGELRSTPGGLVAGQKGTVHSWNIAATYKFEHFRLHSGFGQSKDGLIANSLADAQYGWGYIKGLKFNSYSLGASVPFAKNNTLMASVGLVDPRSVPTGGEKKMQKTYSIGVVNALSKRTDLFVFGSTSENAGFYNKMRSSIASVGMTHKF